MPIQGFNRTAATAQTEQVKKDVEKFSGKTHPAAKLAWVAIGCFIVMAVLFTGYHNWQLYKRGMGGTGVGDALAIVPPILLDGGIIVLLVLLIWYFKDPTQWLVGVVFNILLFVIVIVNTSLNYSLNSGEAMSAELKIYLHWGVLGSFVLVLAMYEILIHVDPNHKRQQEKAKLAAQAQDDLHELEVKTIQHGIEEQKGEVTMGHIIFQNGSLTVPKEKQNLQKLLSIYHPLLNRKYKELDFVADAIDELEDLELEINALNMAMNIEIDQAEAILRVELGSKVSAMTSKELKRDLLLFARNNPSLFLELANDDNVQLRNLAIRAAEAGVIKLSPDQRTFTWGTNDKKLMTVPFDENPYSAMSAFFKTDEGTEVFKSIEKKLK